MVLDEKSVKHLVFFRADASSTIGAGHVMRCLTLADALRHQSVECHFICREEAGHMMAHISERGYKTHSLPTAISMVEDTQKTAEIIESLEAETKFLVVDHYGIGKEWQQNLCPIVHKIMVIDDLADREHDCDVLLDQNMVPDMENRYKKLVPSACRTLIGPNYSLLRPEFAELRKEAKARTFPPEHIFINFGGGDQLGMTLKTLKALAEIGYKNELTVVAGAQNPDAEEVANLCKHRPQTNYYASTNRMAALMNEADLAIGAGGSTTWERFCLGVPTLTVTTADNQLEIAEYLGKKGLIYYAGRGEKLTKVDLADEIRKVFAEESIFHQMRDEIQKVVDGKGAEKVAAVLLERV